LRHRVADAKGLAGRHTDRAWRPSGEFLRGPYVVWRP
jgi:hypothetical protein